MRTLSPLGLEETGDFLEICSTAARPSRSKDVPVSAPAAEAIPHTVVPHVWHLCGRRGFRAGCGVFGSPQSIVISQTVKIATFIQGSGLLLVQELSDLTPNLPTSTTRCQFCMLLGVCVCVF